MRRAFTLIEVLVVIAIIAVLIAILLPALSSARESARAAVCLANLRMTGMTLRLYADNHRGVGPAVGQPYAAFPNWALVVLRESGFEGDAPTDLYRQKSGLVCPTVDGAYPEVMTRTYAMNATGHAGLTMGDPDDYDDPANPAFIRFDLVDRPSLTALLVDSAVTPPAPGAPPPTRTASVLDFRQQSHVQQRLGRFHATASPAGVAASPVPGLSQGVFNTLHFDGSARPARDIPALWLERLP